MGSLDSDPQAYSGLLISYLFNKCCMILGLDQEVLMRLVVLKAPRSMQNLPESDWHPAHVPPRPSAFNLFQLPF